ncbi:ribonuclease J, partial [Escherichia coli]|nr:ribonuclease J [Escherichia coli]
FIFDQNRLSKKPDIGKMAMIGEQGVLCLLSDSINAEKPGYTTSEAVIGQEIASLFHHTKGRIIVATYSSNIQRIQQVIQAVYETNRKLVVVGKSMMK